MLEISVKHDILFKKVCQIDTRDESELMSKQLRIKFFHNALRF